MNDKELKSWRLIVNTLINYDLYDLLEEEIKTVADVLRRDKNE